MGSRAAAAPIRRWQAIATLDDWHGHHITRQGYLEVIEQLCEILGYLRAELLPMTWAEVTPPEDLAVDVASFNRVLAGELDGYAIDSRWVRKDGGIIDSTIVART